MTVVTITVISVISLVVDVIISNVLTLSDNLTPQPENPEHAQPETPCRLSVRS